jgi:hypothetical protein
MCPGPWLESLEFARSSGVQKLLMYDFPNLWDMSALRTCRQLTTLSLANLDMASNLSPLLDLPNGLCLNISALRNAGAVLQSLGIPGAMARSFGQFQIN